MLNELLKCKTYDDLNALATLMIMNPKESLQTFLEEIRLKSLVFNPNDYLSKENLSKYSFNLPLVEKALKEFATEEEILCTLHSIQLFGVCCPAVSNIIDDVLSKTSF